MTTRLQALQVRPPLASPALEADETVNQRRAQLVRDVAGSGLDILRRGPHIPSERVGHVIGAIAAEPSTWRRRAV